MRRELQEIVDERTRAEWEHLILQWVHDETDRRILTRNLLDGVSLDRMAGETGYDRRTVSRRYKRALNQLLKHSGI